MLISFINGKASMNLRQPDLKSRQDFKLNSNLILPQQAQVPCEQKANEAAPNNKNSSNDGNRGENDIRNQFKWCSPIQMVLLRQS